MRAMKTVIYVNGLGRHPDSRMLSGVRSFADEAGWYVVSVPALKTHARISMLKKMWNPSGFVVNCGSGSNQIPLSGFAATPVVFLGCNSKVRDGDRHCIRNDANETAELAARELISLHLDSYAYVTYAYVKRTNSIYWSTARLSAFKSVLELHGASPCIFDATHFGEGEADLVYGLAKWLKRLALPVGVFAANDRMAVAVVHACKLAKLTIPDDVSVIGVDNNEELCEGSKPSISSVSLDFFTAGRIAAAKLESLMSGEPETLPGTYPPLCVVRRESTRRFKRSDKSVSAALERIRREACGGLAPKDVVKMFTCSRRSAQMRFLAATGHSIMREILNARLDAAKNLLRSRGPGIGTIANMCGYKTSAAFCNFFRDETGLTPSAWRNSNGIR